MFDLQRLVADTFIAEVDYRDSVDSTSTVALQRCGDSGIRTPMLVLAAQQTQGRGRGVNQWWSAPGALTFSVVLRPADLGLDEKLWPKTSLTAGLSVCLALDPLVPHEMVQVKWPNDVYLRRRKICGILVETGPRGSQTLVVGIGVNVNNSFDSAPEELQSMVTALVDEVGQPFDLSDVLLSILVQLENQLKRLAHGAAGLTDDWQKHCALQGETVTVATGTQTTRGLCQGIDEDGALVLLTDEGQKRLYSGTVTLQGRFTS